MTSSLGSIGVARCESCGAVWLDAHACFALEKVGLDDAARSFATAAAPRRPVRGPFRETGERSASVRACPVCLRELGARYFRDADVTVRVCEHGALIEQADVASFLLAADIRRTVAEVTPRVCANSPQSLPRLARPGGRLLRAGAAAFLVSLFLPAASVRFLSARTDVHGLLALLFGPLVALEHPMLALPVVANVFALALVVASRRLGVRMNGVLAVVFGLGVFFASMFGVWGTEEVYAGYWLWCASLLAFAVGTGMRAMAAPVGR